MYKWNDIQEICELVL